MTHDITRHYITVNGLQIHYRAAGQGRPVILFHQSPRSSAEYEETIKDWSQDFKVIAPDTPGYGLSDPIPFDYPDMMDFARVMVDFIAALGLEKVGLYGFHTGASMATCVASLIPEKISSAVAYGLAKLPEDEKNDILENYLPSLDVTWDGAHLTWLWARIREQALFFPWYKKDNDSRMPMAMYDEEKMAAQLSDFLHAGNEYSKAYAAAFSLDPDDVLANMVAPLKIIGAPPDPLFCHLERLKGYAESCDLIPYDDPVSAKQGAFDLLKAADWGLGQISSPSIEQPQQSKGYCYPDGNRVHYQIRTRTSALPPLVILPDILGGLDQYQDVMTALSENRTVVVFDLPGHGGSASLGQTETGSFEASSARLMAAVACLKLTEVELMTFGFSALIGQKMRDTSGQIIKHTAVDYMVPAADHFADFEANFMPDISPNSWGGHLLSGWQFCRNKHLFWPWYNQKAEKIIPVDDGFDPVKIHEAFMALWDVDIATVRVLFKDIMAQYKDNDKAVFDEILLPEWSKNKDHIHHLNQQPQYYEITAHEAFLTGGKK